MLQLAANGLHISWKFCSELSQASVKPAPAHQGVQKKKKSQAIKKKQEHRATMKSFPHDL
jgi:hypothetical protein